VSHKKKMVILHIEQLVVFPCSYENDQSRRDAVENIFKMSSLSKNLLLVDKGLCDEVSQSENIYSRTTREQAIKVKKYLQEVKNSLGFAKFKMIVDFGNDDPEFFFQKNHEKHVSFIHFEKGEGYVIPHVVAENYDDFILYDFIVSAYVKSIRFAGGIHYEKVPGGGSQSYNVFKEKKKEKLSVLAILDSDVKHPSGKEGSTSGSFSLTDRDSKNISYAYIMKVHELENLIPLNIYKDSLMMDGPMSTKELERFENISSFISEDSYAYFDFKRGMTLRGGLELDKVHGIFWGEFFKKYKSSKKLECIDGLKCIGCDDCVVIEGLGDSIFNRVGVVLGYKNPIAIYRNLDDSLKEGWDAIAEHLLSFACVSKIKARAS